MTTQHLAFLYLLPLVMTLTHRLRGGGFVTMPFKGTYVLWIIPGLMAWGATSRWDVGLVWALGYLIWILPGWMRLITEAEDAVVPADQVVSDTWDVRLIEDIDHGDTIVGCYLRAAIFLSPLCIGLAVVSAPWWPLVAIVATFWPAYWLASRISMANQSAYAEPVVGLSWGCAMVASIVLMGVQ